MEKSHILTKQKIIWRAENLEQSILEYFVDVDHWNNSVRKPGEDVIDPDPDKRLWNLLAYTRYVQEKLKEE